MNVFTKYSQNQNPPSHISAEITGLKQDSDSSSSISSIPNATVITTNTSPSFKDPLNLNNNKKTIFESSKHSGPTTTILKPLQSSYNSANNSNLVMGNQKPQFSSPISINNSNNNSGSSNSMSLNANISLPSLIQFNSNTRSNTTKNNNSHGLFSSSNSHISINDDTHGRNGPNGGKPQLLSLLLSGNSHHNKLSSLGGQLEQLTGK